MRVRPLLPGGVDVRGWSDRLREDTSRPLGEVLGQCVLFHSFCSQGGRGEVFQWFQVLISRQTLLCCTSGMCLLEEASCCYSLFGIIRGCEFHGTPTGGGEKGSPPPKSSGFVNDGRGFFGGRGIARPPSSSHLRRVHLRCCCVLRRRKDWHLLPSSSHGRGLLRRRRDRPSSSHT